MSSERQDVPATPTGKIVLHGKYLSPIENFVSTVTLNGGDMPFQATSEFAALQDCIVKLHPKFLNRQNALTIAVHECLWFAAEHPDRSGSLSDTKNADLKKALVERFKVFLESLPKNYVLRIDLPSFPGWGARTYEISEGIKLKIGDPRQLKMNSLADLAAGNWDTSPPELASLEFSTTGYVEETSGTTLPASCLSQAKQCAFILTTHNICSADYFVQMRAKAQLIDSSTAKFIYPILPDSLARRLGKLMPDETRLQVREGIGQTLLTQPYRIAETNEEKSEAFDDNLQHLRAFFDAKNEPDFVSIAAAIEWYEDSLFADNQTFSYIAACIGLEALLGSDYHLDSMSKRLCDRYAFLLGKSRDEREKMILEYGKILDLRGELVHSRAARLSDENTHLLSTAQKMLLDMIWHELNAMYAARNRKKISSFASIS